MRARLPHARSDLADLPVDDQLVDLPAPCANALVRGAYRTRAEVAAASDEELGRLRGIGRRRLAAIRAVIPAGAPAPIGAPMPRTTAAAERAERRNRRHDRDRAIQAAILDFLRE